MMRAFWLRTICGGVLLFIASGGAWAANPCVVNTITTNCVSAASVTLTNIVWNPTNALACAGSPISASTGYTNNNGQLQIITTYIPTNCPTITTNIPYAAAVVSNSFEVTGVITTNGPGLSVSLNSTNGGTGNVTFKVFYNVAPCVPSNATATISGDYSLNKVTIQPVFRGAGLPYSLPPTKTYDVGVTIDPALPSGKVAEFEIVNQSADNGTVSITAPAPAQLSGSGGTLTITGGTQTKENVGPKLKIQAKLEGNICAESEAFSVCAHPSEIGFKFNSILSPFTFGGKEFWGAKYDLTFVSDSGTSADCDKTKISENVLIGTKTGWFGTATSSTSGFNQTTGAQADHHADGGHNTAADMKASMDASGFAGIEVADQFFRFSCSRCGIAEDLTSGPKVPTSGFKITHTMSKDANGKYFIHIKKEGNGNNGVSAGGVDDTGVKDAEVKD